MNSWCKNLELLIKSRTSLIWIRTKEEQRLEKILKFSCERLNIKTFAFTPFINNGYFFSSNLKLERNKEFGS